MTVPLNPTASIVGSGVDVVVGGLNWSGGAVERVLKGEMIVTHGGHFLGGAWAMVVLRDYHDGRDFAEEDVRLQFPWVQSICRSPSAFLRPARSIGARSTSRGSARPATLRSRATTLRRMPC